MRPKATPFKKKEAVKRKNRGHWSAHKYEIIAKRALRNTQLDQSQILNFNNHNTRSSTADDLPTNSSVSVSSDDGIDMLHNDGIINGFPNGHVDETEDGDDAFCNISENFVLNEDEEKEEDHNDEFEDDLTEEQMKFEDDLTEEQMKFADEFITTDTSSTPIRDYDELVSKRTVNMEFKLYVRFQDVAVALILVKRKHKCTNSLIDDILKLFTVLKVPRIPSTWFKLKSLIKRSEEVNHEQKEMIESTLFFCPECEQESADSNKCTNEHCLSYFNSLLPPHTFMVFDIQQQIEQVLKSINGTDLDLSIQMSRDFPASMCDIHHGQVYKNVLRSLEEESQKRFISLTCNIDGAAVYTSSEQSMWAFTACLNELNRSIRFDMDKIIVFAVSVGRKKPSRKIMQKMLKPIVSSLHKLEQPRLYQISDYSYQMLRVYLIGVSNDKPANSLVQNQPEPNALYGCSKCEIPGKTVAAKLCATPNQSAKISTTYVRIFPTSKGRQPEIRSNARWCDISHAEQNGVRFYTNDRKLHTYGYLGECELSELAFVDRGTTFMSDTLHSVYHGAFKRLLFIWTETSKKESWCLVKALPSIVDDLSKTLYPATTVRVPRTIAKFLKLKANECRVLLLIGYPIFKNYLPDKYYQHLQKLVFGITIGESSEISPEKLEEMDLLLASFVDEFPYNERYIVQTVHCVKHFATTAKDFGPLSNYSTFNYESVIGTNICETKFSQQFLFLLYLRVGCLSSSVHGTKRIGTELSINLQLFTKAYYASIHHCSSSELVPFIDYVKSGKISINKHRLSNESVLEQDFDLLRRFIPTESEIKLMKSIIHNGLVLSTLTSSKSTTFTNACVVYK
ncbi:unnamed protein product, partial [Adineta ricciae]